MSSIILTSPLVNAPQDKVADHECGLFSIIPLHNCAVSPGQILYDFQEGLSLGANRGQNGFGVCALGHYGGNHKFYRSMSSKWVGSADLEKEINPPQYAIKLGHYQGHIRYSTMGGDVKENMQPMLNDPACNLPIQRQFSLAFNGHIVNAPEIREMLKSKNIPFKTDTDTEVLMRLIEYFDHQTQEKKGFGGSQSIELPDYTEIYRRVDAMIEGGCSATHHSMAGDVTAYRHGEGKRPLYFMKTEDNRLVIASETNQFNGIAGEPECVKEGTIITYNPRTQPEHCLSEHCVGQSRLKFDPLELIYFMNSTSLYSGVYVDSIRHSLGKALYFQEKEHVQSIFTRAAAQGKEVIISPVPNTSIPFSEGFAKAAADDLGLSSQFRSLAAIVREARGRTFIGNAADRKKRATDKYSMRQSVIKDNILFALDDSCIRRLTIDTITQKAFNAGASEVHHFVGSPPVKGVEVSGIALPDYEDLGYWQAAIKLDEDTRIKFAQGTEIPEMHAAVIEQMRQDTEQNGQAANSLLFLTIDSMLRAFPDNGDGISTSIFEGRPEAYDSPAQRKYADQMWTQFVKKLHP